jgi:hypothetical protein
MRGNDVYLEAPGRTQELLISNGHCDPPALGSAQLGTRTKQAHQLCHPKITGTRGVSNSYRIVIRWLLSAVRTTELHPSWR